MNKKDESDAVDPEDARPEGHYPRFRSNPWHYVPEELARTISLGPGGDAEDVKRSGRPQGLLVVVLETQQIG